MSQLSLQLSKLPSSFRPSWSFQYRSPLLLALLAALFYLLADYSLLKLPKSYPIGARSRPRSLAHIGALLVGRWGRRALMPLARALFGRLC